MRAALVTLSACQTGRNVIGGGDELQGLMRAFLSAGAASLVLSLWAVEDRSTAQLMESFYAKLSEGYAKAAALRQVQLDLSQGQYAEGTTMVETYGHPYFWAPFFLMGRPVQREAAEQRTQNQPALTGAGETAMAMSAATAAADPPLDPPGA